MKKKRNKPAPACGSCDLERNDRICIKEGGRASKGCPTLTHKETLEEANREYASEEIAEFARQSSIQEAEGYANRHQRPYIRQPSKTRIVEICEFAKKMGYRRLGLAFCTGLTREGAIVEDILEHNGFEVVSVTCKAGRTPKETIGVQDHEKVYQDTDESMCSPIFQAMVLNREKAEFNIVLGLCVGHDSLFFKYADAPTTVLAAKDRVTGHNPLAAIYLADSYFTKVKHPDE